MNTAARFRTKLKQFLSGLGLPDSTSFESIAIVDFFNWMQTQPALPEGRRGHDMDGQQLTTGEILQGQHYAQDRESVKKR